MTRPGNWHDLRMPAGRPTGLLPDRMRKVLKRMDPAELLVELAVRGRGVQREPGESYGAWLEREKRLILAGAHKARVMQAKAFTRDEVEASRRWLLENGFYQGVRVDG